MSVKIFKSSKHKEDKKKVKESISLKVIEKFNQEPVYFDSKEEFAEYLTENKDKMNEITTVTLNKMYKINGYKITKIKDEISLRKVNSELNNEVDNDLKSDILDIKRMLKILIETLISP